MVWWRDLKNELKCDLKAQLDAQVAIRENVKAASCTTFGLGAALPLVIEPQSCAALREAIRVVRRFGFGLRVLGNGSNVVLPDEEVAFPVFRLGRQFKSCVFCKDAKLADLERVLVGGANELVGENAAPNEFQMLALAQAGTVGLSQRLCAMGLAGFEYAGGIPAAVGGAICMNAGAHGWCVADNLSKFWTVDGAGEFKERAVRSGEMSYRSGIVGQNEIVIAGLFHLQQDDSPAVQARRRAALERRQETQPLNFPSAGSVFRNPVTAEGAAMPAGRLLEECGLKGFRCGGVEYSTLHANWLIKVGSEAKTGDVHFLMAEGMRRVKEKFGIELKSEIVFW